MEVGYADIHDPVMVDRIVELLSPPLQRPGAVYVDATLGLAGHAIALLDANPGARLVGIDRDPDAHAVATERLGERISRATLVEAVYDEIPDVLADLGLPAADAILMDLGLSSLQIDRRERGFSYSVDAPLDMRMGKGAARTAADVVNTYPAGELVRLLRRYGEERFAERIVERIVHARESGRIERSGELVELITAAVPAAARYSGSHPAKRTFQALRIEVNDELRVLERALPSAVASLGLGGRIAVLAYHSLEDRPVKQVFAQGASDKAPRGLPSVPEHLRAELRLVTRGAEKPSPHEIETNPRSASARLRVAERVRESA